MPGAQDVAGEVDDGARGDGGAAEGVEVATVFFDGKAGVGKGFAGKAVYPRVDAGFDFVAKPGGFFVGKDAHAAQGAVVVGNGD